jgi:hypothetical protein
MPLIFSFSCLEDIWNRIHTSENLRHFQDNNPFGVSRFKLKIGSFRDVEFVQEISQNRGPYQEFMIPLITQ